MIKSISINNFKSHKKTDLTLKNLTVLTGVNSIGKSSIVQALLLLRQSFIRNKLFDGLELNDDIVKLGTYDEVLYRHADKSEISFLLKDESEQYDFSFSTDKADSNFIDKLTYSKNVLQDNLLELSLFNTNFQYLSANRIGGESIFQRSDYEVKKMHQISKFRGQGELAVQFLLEYQNSKCIISSEKGVTLLDEVRFWEQKISERMTFEIIDGKDGKVSIFYGYSSFDDVKKPMNGIRSENMGFGVSYSFPIIVALLSAAPGSIIIIENPEAHLHPQGQSEIANLISVIAQKGVQIIIETHSDHIINGILVNVKKHHKNNDIGIDKDNVALYYLNRSESDDSVKSDQVLISQDGKIEYQPKGFFDKAESDLFYLSGFEDD